MRRAAGSSALLVCVFVILVTSRADAAPAGAHALEGRLFAPCCYVQTLDIHESELATTLRTEIRTRLASGEAPELIEDDLARRYGERIRAVPRGRDPRGSIPLILGIVMLLSAAALLAWGLRWARRRIDAGSEEAAPESAAYDADLDAELRRIDD